MGNIPVRISERISKNVKKFQNILLTAKDNDINEADTVSIIKDMLSEIFGYDKYTEITSEYAVKKTFCDLAIKKNDKPHILIEVKAIGIDLKDTHTKQALDYGANAGVEWIILSNGIIWKIYEIVFEKPIRTNLIYEFDITQLNTRKTDDIELLYVISKEAINKNPKQDALTEYKEQKQLTSKYLIGQLLLTDDVLNCIRRNIRKISSTVKVSNEDIKAALENEVIKRDIFSNEEKCNKMKKLIVKANKPITKKKTQTDSEA